MTVSFFLKRSKDKKKGIRDAWTYGASIVVIYVALGLAITLIFRSQCIKRFIYQCYFQHSLLPMLVILLLHSLERLKSGCRRSGEMQ